jgi:hypothetical protein
MRDSPDAPHAADDATAPLAGDDAWGWYLYGIVRARGAGEANIGDSTPAEGADPLETISSDDLLAVVRQTPLSEFSPEALQARANDAAWIEDVARRHNAVIEGVHQTQTILPAKFGCVYAHAEDVQAALHAEHDALLARLRWLDGCDEWGVRLYGDGATLRQRAEAEQTDAKRLQEELASASPGRAYFLRRKLADELDSASERLLDGLRDQAYERFMRHARAGQVGHRVTGGRLDQLDQLDQDAESVEIMRATFLVPRDAADHFVEDVRAFAESQPGMWCEYSGPWAPYSFAATLEQAQEE